MKDHIRRCIFRPYRKGMGPSFVLDLYDLGRYHGNGPQWALGYRLTMVWDGERTLFGKLRGCRVVLFEADDYGCSPCHGIDSDAAVEGIMGFLTLRPGDTDSDYFEAYTPAQLDYCANHAESLACEVQARFCDENGNVIRR